MLTLETRLAGGRHQAVGGERAAQRSPRAVMKICKFARWGRSRHAHVAPSSRTRGCPLAYTASRDYPRKPANPYELRRYVTAGGYQAEFDFDDIESPYALPAVHDGHKEVQAGAAITRLLARRRPDANLPYCREVGRGAQAADQYEPTNENLSRTLGYLGDSAGDG